MIESTIAGLERLTPTRHTWPHGAARRTIDLILALGLSCGDPRQTPRHLRIIPDRDVWAAALAIVKRYGDDAMQEAVKCADERQEAGDWEGAVTWHRILDCIERLQAQKPAAGESVQ